MSLYEHALRVVRGTVAGATIAAAVLALLLTASPSHSAYAADTATATTRAWNVRSIDTMHLTRDYACWPESASFMASIAASVKAMGANYASVATAYDAADNYHSCNATNPTGYERAWVQALRTQGLRVWFRQTWFNWEGSYGAPKLTANTTPAIQLGTAAEVLAGTDTTSYLAKTYRFILSHPYLFADWDIFTPEPEPQNGGIQQSWGHYDPAMTQFHDWPRTNQWLRDSMTVDTAAFAKLGIRVTVGAWGLPCSNYQWNGANNIEATTIAQMGPYVTDCYFHDVSQVVAGLQVIRDTYHTSVIVGEWGNVWNIDTTPQATANEVTQMLTAAHALPWVTGFNYWQIYGGGGSESLVDPDTLQLNLTGIAVQRSL